LKLAIMQPYFFPYIGYWQLIKAVDCYIIYDDVNFIKGGWITRNRILNNGLPSYLSLHTYKASSFVHINEVEIANDNVKKRKLIDTLKNNYGKAPYFELSFPIIEKIILSSEVNLASFLFNSITEICKYLNIKTELKISSQLIKNTELSGQAKIIDICKRMRATHYYNAIGGQILYQKDEFDKNGIVLKFLSTRPVEYKQFNNDFCPNLSIIDVMMFNSKEEISNMLMEYDLV